MEAYRDCPVCNKKDFYIPDRTMWGYKRRIGYRYHYVCSWSCVNDDCLPDIKKKNAYAGEHIKKELNGKCGKKPAKSNKRKAIELEELENKRRDIEKSMKKGAWIQ